MTYKEVHYAAMIRIPLIVPHTLTPLMKPKNIVGLNTVYRTVEESIRYGNQYYHVVVLADPNGRGVIRAFPEQLDPADPERFAAMWDRYRKMREEKNAIQ